MLARLDRDQLKNLLQNLSMQRANGRVTEQHVHSAVQFARQSPRSKPAKSGK